jgi:hypothetical protein
MQWRPRGDSRSENLSAAQGESYDYRARPRHGSCTKLASGSIVSVASHITPASESFLDLRR